VIKIRYAGLPQGLHAQVRSGGRRPVIYLLPGLSPAQRRDALRRLIRTSRQGHGPHKPCPTGGAGGAGPGPSGSAPPGSASSPGSRGVPG